MNRKPAIGMAALSAPARADEKSGSSRGYASSGVYNVPPGDVTAKYRPVVVGCRYHKPVMRTPIAARRSLEKSASCLHLCKRCICALKVLVNRECYRLRTMRRTNRSMWLRRMLSDSKQHVGDGYDSALRWSAVNENMTAGIGRYVLILRFMSETTRC